MKKLAIVSPNKFKYSETFIHGHMRHLNFEKWLLHGDYFPVWVSRALEGEEQPLSDWQLPRSWWKKKADAEQLQRDSLAHFLRRQPIDAVLAEYGPSGVRIHAACQKAKVPLVVHFHGFDAYRDDVLSYYGPEYPELFASAAALVAVSKDMQQQLIGLGAPAHKVHWIPYGIDLEQFSPVDPAQNPPRAVAVGRFTPKKAPLDLLSAFALVRKEMPAAELDYLGDGELLEAAQDFADSDPHLKGGVHFWGRSSPAQVREALRGARVFAQASKVPRSGDSEGLPLAVLEAMGTGLPVVATEHAGIPDAVRDGQEGRLSPPSNVVALARNLLELLQQPQLARKMGENSRKRAEQRFSQERYYNELESLLHSVMR